MPQRFLANNPNGSIARCGCGRGTSRLSPRPRAETAFPRPSPPQPPPFAGIRFDVVGQGNRRFDLAFAEFLELRARPREVVEVHVLRLMLPPSFQDGSDSFSTMNEATGANPHFPPRISISSLSVTNDLGSVVTPYKSALLDPKMATGSLYLVNRWFDRGSKPKVPFDTPARTSSRIQRQRQRRSTSTGTQ